MRGTGSAHHIHVTELGEKARAIGVGFAVKTREDLEEISRKAGVAIEQVSEPGGGVRAVLTDPNGIRVEIVHGQDELDPISVREPLVFNHARESRRLESISAQ